MAQEVDDETSITWHLSVELDPVATNINDPEITKQQFFIYLYNKGVLYKMNREEKMKPSAFVTDF